MKKNNHLTEKKRGLGRGLEVLLADTQSMDALHSTSTNPADANPADPAEKGKPAENTQTSNDALRTECLQLLKEAEALRILLLEFELIIRADLH
ncbi:MAG: hypothetical protein PHH59_13850 [Methylovulum sp.]|uniref:hypothetical protein n=1 Tax=Methylovulum sp. TaxID=1916980 RepID=UPI0026194A7B|nr:hypothetical protein [Methylovulum sp.]MDD2725090.1 hypothetical protein [Methylovulum sp.]MDD5124138.1 hypothetical protein [Methylovulum sp.]